jgi:regulator of protease activity HflC (stomatin/prohibitin superfamily)
MLGRRRRSFSEVLAERRLPREQRRAARSERKRDALQASAQGRAAALDAEARRYKSFEGRP